MASWVSLGQNSPLLKIETLALVDPFLRLLSPLPLRRRQHCAPLAVAPAVGAAALGWHLAGRWAPCPQAAPLWVGRWLCFYSLAMGKRRLLLAGHGRVLPLRPGHGRAPPLTGWPRATAPAS
ncbi:hypothetical protein GW17_00061883 [Ensete ventricosum]|nr:hypothetical protein GW17_00061883 [Ensete ventricosum]